MGKLLDVGDSAVGDARRIKGQLAQVTAILDDDVDVANITNNIQVSCAPLP